MGLSLCFSMSCVVLGEKGSFVLLKNLLVQKGQGNLEVEGTETSFSYQGKWDFPWNQRRSLQGKELHHADETGKRETENEVTWSSGR